MSVAPYYHLFNTVATAYNDEIVVSVREGCTDEIEWRRENDIWRP